MPKVYDVRHCLTCLRVESALEGRFSQRGAQGVAKLKARGQGVRCEVRGARRKNWAVDKTPTAQGWRAKRGSRQWASALEHEVPDDTPYPRSAGGYEYCLGLK